MRGSIASSGKNVCLTVSVGILLAALLISFDSGFNKPSYGPEQMKLFQQLIGGLGMGASVTPAWTLLDYDPRLQSIDDSSLWPIAGIYPYSPTAVSTAVSFTELPREGLRIIRIEP